MTKVAFHAGFPIIDREEFLTPFDRMFDQIVSKQFPSYYEFLKEHRFQGLTPNEWHDKMYG